MTTIEQWQQIETLDSLVETRLKGDLAAVDALHGSWLEFADSLDEVDRTTLRRRTLRKHAIETGILERLYDIDWGLTEALVADGLTREAVARAGGDLPPGVLPMLEAQLEGVEMVADYVRRNASLATSFVKELHALITRAQRTTTPPMRWEDRSGRNSSTAATRPSPTMYGAAMAPSWNSLLRNRFPER